jgi:hypothetical protein
MWQPSEGDLKVKPLPEPGYLYFWQEDGVDTGL